MTIFRSAVNLQHLIPDAGDRCAGQIVFAEFTSSGWLDQGPLVALRIEEDLEGPSSVALDAAYPLGTKDLGLPGSCNDVRHSDVEVKPILDDLGLGNLLEGESGPSRRIHVMPGLISSARRPAQHR
jgi:hypothetical protein